MHTSNNIIMGHTGARRTAKQCRSYLRMIADLVECGQADPDTVLPLVQRLLRELDAALGEEADLERLSSFRSVRLPTQPVCTSKAGTHMQKQTNLISTTVARSADNQASDTSRPELEPGND